MTLLADIQVLHQHLLLRPHDALALAAYLDALEEVGSPVIQQARHLVEHIDEVRINEFVLDNPDAPTWGTLQVVAGARLHQVDRHMESVEVRVNAVLPFTNLPERTALGILVRRYAGGQWATDGQLWLPDSGGWRNSRGYPVSDDTSLACTAACVEVGHQWIKGALEKKSSA